MRKTSHLLLTLMLMGCTALYAQDQDTTKPGWLLRREARENAQWQKQQEKMYEKAVKDAQDISAHELVDDLWGVNDPQVTRSTDSMVLVLIPLPENEISQWTGSAAKNAPASMKPQEMWWVSLDPQLSAFLQNEPIMDSSSLVVSVKQLLGLPPQSDYSYIAAFLVSPKNLFRPTPDPDPTIHYSSVTFPDQVDPAHKTWIEQCRKEAYTAQPPIAWTQLGYAYDWGNPVRPVGVSQFVVKSNAPIRVVSISSLWYWYNQQVNTSLSFPVKIIE